MTPTLKRWLACTLLISLMQLAAASALAADWPQWLGPTRNGVSPEAVEPWNDPPKVLWRQPIGNGYSVPVIAGGVVFTHAAVAGKDAEEVTAIDLSTGKVKWTKTYPRAPYKSILGVGPRATPTVSGEHLVTFGITGELTCFRTDTGERVWQCNPYSDNTLPLPQYAVCCSPLVLADRVIVPVGGAGMAVAAYDLKDGKLAWKALDEPASSASPIAWRKRVGDAEQVEVVAQTTLRTVGLDPTDGTLRWEHSLVFEPSGVSPTPLVAHQRLVCTTQDTGTLSIESPLEAKGKTKLSWWHQDMSGYFSTGTVAADGRIFLITNVVMPLPSADVRCLDPQTGKELWRKNGLGYFHVGLIALANDRLLILDDAGKLILADCGRKEYKELCRTKICGGTFVNPVLANGHLVVRDGKEVQCLQLSADE